MGELGHLSTDRTEPALLEGGLSAAKITQVSACQLHTLGVSRVSPCHQSLSSPCLCGLCRHRGTHLQRADRSPVAVPGMAQPAWLPPQLRTQKPRSGDATFRHLCAGLGALARVTLAIIVLEGHKSLPWPCALGDYALGDPGFLCHTQGTLNCIPWGPMIRVRCPQRMLLWALGERGT